jgi:hypothetical protein
MLFKRLVPLFALFAFAAGTAEAQTVTLQANQTSATGSLVPVLTWSTSPAAQSCTASGGWSGAKAASGNQTLASINASTNYTLTCRWATAAVNVLWDAPTTNTDGSALTDLAGFKVVYGTSSTSLTSTATVYNTAARSTSIPSLAAGTWYFAVRAFNANQTDSPNSNVTSKVVTEPTAARTVGITINATPPPPPPPTTPPPSGTPSLKTIATPVYETFIQGRDYVLGRVVGSIALEKPCNAGFIVGNYTHYKVTNSDVTFTLTPVSSIVVARCTTH